MFKFFNHGGANKPESQTLNTTENSGEVKIEDSSELTYQNSDYQEVLNEINLDPEFFIKEVESTIDAKPDGLQEVDLAEFTCSEEVGIGEVGGADDTVPFEILNKASEVSEVSETPNKDSKTGGIQRMLKGSLPLASAFAFLASVACEKRGEIGFGVGVRSGDDGPAHRVKLLLGIETHTDEIGPDGVPVKKGKDGKVIYGDSVKTEAKTEANTETKPEPKTEPKTESNEGSDVMPKSGEATTPTEKPTEPKTENTSTVSKEDSESMYTEPVKPTPPQMQVEQNTVPAHVAPAPKETSNIESTPANHEGPGRKMAEYTKEILPSGDFENGALVLNDAALEAISRGCLAYSHESHCFATSLTKDFKKQGLPAETVAIYGLHKGDKPRPPMPGKFFSNYAKVISTNPPRVDFRYFDMKAFDRDLELSVNKTNYTNAKGVFDAKKHAKAVEDVKDYGHETLKAIITWAKLGKQEQAKEDLFKEKCSPYMNRK